METLVSDHRQDSTFDDRPTLTPHFSTKPCLQVVLWKPHGDHVKDLLAGVNGGTGQIPTITEAPTLRTAVEVSDGSQDAATAVVVSPNV